MRSSPHPDGFEGSGTKIGSSKTDHILWRCYQTTCGFGVVNSRKCQRSYGSHGQHRQLKHFRDSLDEAPSLELSSVVELDLAACSRNAGLPTASHARFSAPKHLRITNSFTPRAVGARRPCCSRVRITTRHDHQQLDTDEDHSCKAPAVNTGRLCCMHGLRRQNLIPV